jgi:type IV pilus assembly protein PilY1
MSYNGKSYKAERVITNPLAAFTGAVFFTTFAPSAEVCGFGGTTYLWSVDYRTGGAPKPSALYGTALVQVSTGEIKEFPLSSVFTQKGGRRTEGASGVPPKNQGLTVVVRPQPIKKILHMQER